MRQLRAAHLTGKYEIWDCTLEWNAIDLAFRPQSNLSISKDLNTIMGEIELAKAARVTRGRVGIETCVFFRFTFLRGKVCFREAGTASVFMCLTDVTCKYVCIPMVGDTMFLSVIECETKAHANCQCQGFFFNLRDCGAAEQNML